MQWSVAVPGGEVPVLADDHGPGEVFILAHGAGGHMEQKTVEWLASLARRAGLGVVRFNFLYKAQGRSMPDRMQSLIEQYRAVILSTREKLNPKRLLIGGHSMGGRVASMLEAESQTADGLLLFAYPLHPPDKPEKLRDAHLPSIKTPTLQFSGSADELCTKTLMLEVYGRLDPQNYEIHWIEGASHSYALSKASGRKRPEMEQEIVDQITKWLSGE